MRVKKENFVKGCCLHLFNHAIENLDLFINKEDYMRIIQRFREKIVVYPSTIFAYCLMPNHFHFFMKQDSNEPIYKIFNEVFSGYTLYYNHKYKRAGTLFKGPLQHKLISTQEYFYQLCLYIHFNPVHANIVKKPEDWLYSNYLEWIGKRNGRLFSKEVYELLDVSPEEYANLMKLYSKERFERDRDLFEK